MCDKCVIIQTVCLFKRKQLVAQYVKGCPCGFRMQKYNQGQVNPVLTLTSSSMCNYIVVIHTVLPRQPWSHTFSSSMCFSASDFV